MLLTYSIIQHKLGDTTRNSRQKYQIACSFQGFFHSHMPGMNKINMCDLSDLSISVF